MSATELTAAVRQGLADLTTPLREQLAQLDAVIEVQTAELAQLRETRLSVKRMLALLDPESAPKKASTKKYAQAGSETTRTLGETLRRNAEQVNSNGGFTATSLIRDEIPGFAGRSVSTIGKVLTNLHEQGLIRLDHRGRGGANYYKVVT